MGGPYMTDTWVIPLVSSLLGAAVGGLSTYAGSWCLKKRELSTQIRAARNALCIAMQADAEFCGHLADSHERSGSRNNSMVLLQSYLITSRDLLLPVIQSHPWHGVGNLSKDDIQKLIDAFRVLATTALLSETELPADCLASSLRAAQKKCNDAACSLAAVADA